MKVSWTSEEASGAFAYTSFETEDAQDAKVILHALGGFHSGDSVTVNVHHDEASGETWKGEADTLDFHKWIESLADL